MPQTLLYCLMHLSVTTVGKRGREISPSCFCHSQLILSCPPLYSSSFHVAHRIWPGPLCFQQWCFLDRAIPAKMLATPFKLVFFFSSLFLSLSLCTFLCLFHWFLWSINHVSSLKKTNICARIYFEIFFPPQSLATGCVIIERGLSV